MISSHFDSAALVPGAGDAGVMIVSQLEIFQNILSKDLPPSNPIIFFFNNGEEIGLVGARAFIQKQDSWAKK
jgi:Zn-dependent M28 family amino/carboxypeptidase